VIGLAFSAGYRLPAEQVEIPKRVTDRLDAEYGAYRRIRSRGERLRDEAVDLGQLAQGLDLIRLSNDAWTRICGITDGVVDSLDLPEDDLTTDVLDRVLPGRHASQGTA
jgi:hypothetical protein